MPLVDVRDCALAHVKAMQLKSVDYMRVILVEGTYWMSDMINIVRKEFYPHGYPIKKPKVVSKWKLKIGSIWDSGVIFSFFL